MWTPIPDDMSKNTNVDFLLGPIHSKHVKRYLECSEIPFEVVTENLQEQIDKENDVEDDDSDELLIGRPGNEQLFL